MKWHYFVMAIVSMCLLLFGIILGYLSVLTPTQSIIIEMIGWILLLVLSIARVIDIKKK